MKCCDVLHSLLHMHGISVYRIAINNSCMSAISKLPFPFPYSVVILFILFSYLHYVV